MGAEFLFGASFKDHFFAFKVLPAVVVFSAMCSLLYFMGIMQVVIRFVRVRSGLGVSRDCRDWCSIPQKSPVL